MGRVGPAERQARCSAGDRRDQLTQAVCPSPDFRRAGQCPAHQWEKIKEAQVDRAKALFLLASPQMAGPSPLSGQSGRTAGA